MSTKQLAAEEAKGMAYMGVFEMDLNDQAQMNKIFNQQTPVLILFYNGQRHERKIEKIANRVSHEAMIDTPVGDGPPFETYLANTEVTADALRSFNLRKSDCPIAVIHYTKAGDRKFLMTEENGDLPLSASTLRRFVKQVTRGQRQPNPRKTMPPPRKRGQRTDL